MKAAALVSGSRAVAREMRDTAVFVSTGRANSPVSPGGYSYGRET